MHGPFLEGPKLTTLAKTSPMKPFFARFVSLEIIVMSRRPCL